MLIHYLKIAFRNIAHYKTQSLISIAAIAMSLTLLALITSLLQRFYGMPMLETGYADRVVEVQTWNRENFFTPEDQDLIKSHRFNNVEKVYTSDVTDSLVAYLTAIQGTDTLAILSSINVIEPDLLSWMGYKSEATSKTLKNLSQHEVIISKYISDQLFPNRNPIGEKLQIKVRDEKAEYQNGEYTIVDVIKDESLNDSNRFGFQVAFVPITEQTPTSTTYKVYFHMRDGYGLDEFIKEIKEIFPQKEMTIYTVESRYGSDRMIMTIMRDSVFVFLVLFLLVSLSSFLRQQSQLFTLRQRELALRTTIGSKPSQLLAQMLTESFIILLFALGLSLVLSYLVRGFILREYAPMLSQLRWHVDSLASISLKTFAGIAVVTFGVCVFTLWKIRSAQRGLALRMRPLPKHRLGKIGITLQLIVGILFVWATLLLLFSAPKFYKDLPENDDYYRQGLSLELNGYMDEQYQLIVDRLKQSPYIEEVVSDNRMMTGWKMPNGEYLSVQVVFQREGQMVDFYRLKIIEPRKVSTPGHSAIVSLHLKEELEKHGMWNGYTIDYYGDVYEIEGFIEKFPYQSNEDVLILTNSNTSDADHGNLMIIPKEGKRKEAQAEADRITREVMNNRIDLKTEPLYSILAPKHLATTALIIVILTLSIISIITTIATIYSTIALETRGRLKEMALRKINGAKTSDIRKIFLRTYIIIMVICFIVTFSIGLLLNSENFFVQTDLDNHPFLLYFTSIVMVCVIVFLTLWWRIRQVMRVDPVEYLKE